MPVLLAFLTADHGNRADNRVPFDIGGVEVRVQSGDRYESNGQIMFRTELCSIGVERVVKKGSEEDEKNSRALLRLMALVN